MSVHNYVFLTPRVSLSPCVFLALFPQIQSAILAHTWQWDTTKEKVKALAWW